MTATDPRPRPLVPGQAALVLDLAAAAEAADGVAPLSEQTMLHLQHRTGLDSGLDWVAADGSGNGIAGYAHLDPDPSDPDLSGELVVHPAHRRQGHGTALVAALAEAAGDGASENGAPENCAPEKRGLRIWAHGDRPAAAEFAKATGFTRARELWQMLLPVRDARLPSPALPDGVTLRTFVPGADEETWLAVNRRAFAHHPEQGRMTRTDLDLREAEPWFDPAGFFLAERSGELVGFHWTKVHPSGGTDGGPIGEVYVVGVDPAGQGGGLGKALTIAGLAHLRDRGLAEVMLYVDADNTAATRLYENLGFAPWHVDVMYERGARQAPR